MSFKKGLKIQKDILEEFEKCKLTPRVIGIIMRGLVTFLIYSLQKLNRDLQSLLKKFDNPSPISDSSRNKTNKRRVSNPLGRSRTLLQDESQTGSGNKYRTGFQTNYMNNLSEITLLDFRNNLSHLQFQEMNDHIAFLNRENGGASFIEALDNFFPGQNLPDNFEFQFDSLTLPLGTMTHGFGEELHFNRENEKALFFTQKLNQNYQNFLMITPTKLKDENYFGYIEDQTATARKKMREGDRVIDFTPKQGKVNRTLQFDSAKKSPRSHFLEDLEQRDSGRKLNHLFDQPQLPLSEELMEVWDFTYEKNDIFAKNLEMFHQKAAEMVLRKQSGVALNNLKEIQHLHQSGGKTFQQNNSQTNSIAAKSHPNSDFKGDILEKDDYLPNYEIIEEAINEVNSASQMFLLSESNINPPTYSYEISLNQFAHQKSIEESKKNETRKNESLAKETNDLYVALIRGANKSDKNFKFSSLIKDATPEQKGTTLLHMLTLVTTGKIEMKQGRKQMFGEIIIRLT